MAMTSVPPCAPWSANGCKWFVQLNSQTARKKSTHPTASQSHTPTTEQQFTTSTINTLSLRCWPGLRWYPGQEFLSACSPSHHILLACQSHQNWFITFRIEIDLKRNLASVITFQVGFPVPKVLQQDQTECKFTSPPLQPQSCVVETPKVVVPSFEDFRNSHQRRMSCAFHNAILSEGRKLFKIPARTTIRSPNHYPLEDSFHELLPTAKRWITET